MKSKLLKYLILSHATLVLTLLICILIDPAALLRNYPLSYYGTTLPAAIPYTIGFVLTSILILKVASLLPDDKFNMTLQRALRILVVLLIGILVTPYRVSLLVGHIHLIIAGAFFAFEAGIATWLIIKDHHDAIDVFLLFVQVVGCIIILLSIKPYIHLLVVGQLMAILAFGVLMTRNLSRIEKLANST